MSINRTQLSIPHKKTRLRFRDEDDLIFLREVIGYNPFQQPDLWAVIQEHIFAATGKMFSVKTLKDHLDLLIKIWLEKIKKYKDRSGIEEDYTEKDKLLEEVHGLMVDFRTPPKKKQKQIGVLARDHWAKENYNSVLPTVYNENELVVIPEFDFISADNENSSQGMTVLLDHQYTLENPAQQEASSILTSKRPLEINSQENGNFSQRSGEIEKATTSTTTLELVENQQTHAPTSQASINFFATENSCDKRNVLKNTDISDMGEASKKTPTGLSKGKYNVFSRTKSRARLSGAQKQGLAIVQEYDKNQNEFKRKELELREKELQIQEKKLELENRRLSLEERRDEQKEQTKRKTLEILENAMSGLNRIVENQEKLIYFIVSEKK